MIGKVEYLEKYSVAPPPSRDYYGLKIHQDEVILYIWKISHGPHRTPISRSTKFLEFDQDKALQEDIKRSFGEHFVNYVKSIAEGKGNTLLTLPRSSLGKIVEFLEFEDIVNLSSLSRIANVIFSDNFIWEALYRRHKRFNIRREERDYAMAYGWKQAFKEKQMAVSSGLHKIPGSTIKRDNLKMEHRLTKSISGPLKTISKASSSSINSETVAPLQITQKNAETNLTKSFRNNVIDDAAKSIQTDKKTNTNIKKVNNAKVNRTHNAKSGVIKEKSIVRKTESKHDVRESFSDSMTVTRKTGTTQRNQKSVVTAKGPNTTMDITGKGKFGDSKRNVQSKSTLSMIKSNDVVTAGQQVKSKSRSKNKTKTKTLTQNDSNILSTDKSFLDESLVMKNENFELACLIEESLKRIRSPRTVFDYDFSYLRDSKTSSDATRNNEDTGKTISMMKDSKRDQGTTRLDRLSENSDSMTTLSNDSIIDDFKANESDRSAIKIPTREKNKSWDSKMVTLPNDSMIDNVKAIESDRSAIKIPMREKNKSWDSKIITGRDETIERVTDFNKKSPKKSQKITDEMDKKYSIPKGIQMPIKSPKITDDMDKKYSIPKGIQMSIKSPKMMDEMDKKYSIPKDIQMLIKAPKIMDEKDKKYSILKDIQMPIKGPKIMDEVDKKFSIPKGIQMPIKSPKIMDEMDKKYSIPKDIQMPIKSPKIMDEMDKKYSIPKDIQMPIKSPKIMDEMDKKYSISKDIQMPIKSPKIMDEMDKKYSIPKGVLNSIDIMKSLKSSSPVIKSTTTSGKNFMASSTNRFALKKSLNELRKDQIIQYN